MFSILLFDSCPQPDLVMSKNEKKLKKKKDEEKAAILLLYLLQTRSYFDQASLALRRILYITLCCLPL